VGTNKNTPRKCEPLDEREPFGLPAARQVPDLDFGRDWNGGDSLNLVGGIRGGGGEDDDAYLHLTGDLESRKNEAVYEMVGLL
jgi:hypothetical protein